MSGRFENRPVTIVKNAKMSKSINRNSAEFQRALCSAERVQGEGKRKKKKNEGKTRLRPVEMIFY